MPWLDSMSREGANDPMWYRTNGTRTCSKCGKRYGEHPLAREKKHLGWNNEPFLNRLCSGDLVKL